MTVSGFSFLRPTRTSCLFHDYRPAFWVINVVIARYRGIPRRRDVILSAGRTAAPSLSSLGSWLHRLRLMSLLQRLKGVLGTRGVSEDDKQVFVCEQKLCMWISLACRHPRGWHVWVRYSTDGSCSLSEPVQVWKMLHTELRHISRARFRLKAPNYGPSNSRLLWLCASIVSSISTGYKPAWVLCESSLILAGRYR